MCRKAHGSAFRARGKVKAAQFRWTAGEHLVRYYESSPGTHRGFCCVCGSNLVSKFDQKPKVLGLALVAAAEAEREAVDGRGVTVAQEPGLPRAGGPTSAAAR